MSKKKSRLLHVNVVASFVCANIRAAQIDVMKVHAIFSVYICCLVQAALAQQQNANSLSLRAVIPAANLSSLGVDDELLVSTSDVRKEALKSSRPGLLTVKNPKVPANAPVQCSQPAALTSEMIDNFKSKYEYPISAKSSDNACGDRVLREHGCMWDVHEFLTYLYDMGIGECEITQRNMQRCT